MLKLSNILSVGTGFLAALGAVSLMQSDPAHAQSPGMSLASLVGQINDLRSQVSALDTKVAAEETKTSALTVRLSSLENQHAALYSVAINSTLPKVTALENKTAPLTLSGTNLTLSGVNVRIVSGSGNTDDTTGLGNLTIGYNLTRSGQTNPTQPDIRTGSHNLIVGDGNNYSSYGGIVAGQVNRIGAKYATVLGGFGNTAGRAPLGGRDTGGWSSIGGGYNNVTHGSNGVVGGGVDNILLSVGTWVAGNGNQSNSITNYIGRFIAP
ncbi:MAG: hypothetical protein H7Z41_02260 [Cytophagales bacterium]|nr:hypothetical protein [Armatimonadota bacterium]